jgi:hypothetical protein
MKIVNRSRFRIALAALGFIFWVLVARKTWSAEGLGELDMDSVLITSSAIIVGYLLATSRSM